MEGADHQVLTRRAAGRRHHSDLQNVLEPEVDSTQGWNSELRVFQVAWQLRRGGPQETDPAHPRAVWEEPGPGVP